MSIFRVPAPLVMALASAAILSAPAVAVANGCTFRGEIVYSDDYEKIVIERADPARAGDALGPHAPLFPGDTLLVRGDRVIWIRDKPGGDLREITAGNGRVTIGQPETCDVRDGFELTLGGLLDKLSVILWSPVADQPVETVPRMGGEVTPAGIQLDLEEALLVADGLDLLSVHWGGLNATVVLRSTADDSVRLSARSNDVLVVEERLDRSLRTGEVLSLEFRSQEGQISRSITVVPTDQLPKPEGVENLHNLTPNEATIYAIWLATEGPPEWRLQGLTMLSKAPERDYMAWKVLRGLRAGSSE